MIPAAVGLAAAALVGLLAWVHHRRVLRQFDSVLDEFDVSRGREGGASARVGHIRRLVERERATTADLATERVEIERALDALPLGVILVNSDSHLIMANDMGRRFVGARHGDALVGAAVDKLMHAALDGETVGQRLDLAGPTGRSFELGAVPLGISSTPTGAVGIIDDVTDHKRLEDMRRDFVSNISHELKTPIGAVSVMADALDGEDDPDTIAALTPRISSEMIRLANIIDDLLDLSSIEVGEGMSLEPVSVARVIGEAVERTTSAVSKQAIDLQVDEIDPSLCVQGDDRQLVSAVHNLLANAVKYSDEGGTVSVRVAEGAASIEIEIEDRGIGIPTRDHERVFERFYRVDRGRSRATGGTGLGLAIVRHVAVNHGGSIRVHSREGEGSAFTLSIPRSADDAPIPSAVAPMSVAPDPAHIEENHLHG